MFQELLTLVDCEVAIGAILARALQQGDVTKRAVDDIRRLYKGCSQQHLAYLLKRQGVEASVLDLCANTAGYTLSPTKFNTTNV